MHLGTFYPYFLCICNNLDNQNPRAEKGRVVDSSLKGRLLAAHQNQLESFPGFAASVLTAVVLKSGNEIADLAWLHVVCRCLYWGFYAINIPSMRSLVFVIGCWCVVLIFIEGIF
jgi:uncharacterized MAPEG superfamily protein